MNNIYYYTFYLMVKMFKWLNKEDNSSDFSGVCLLSILLFFNVNCFWVPITGTLINRHNLKFIDISVILILIGFNYFLLIYKGKSQRIIFFLIKNLKIKSKIKLKLL